MAAVPMVIIVPTAAMERKIVAIPTAPLIAPIITNSVRRGESIAVTPPSGPIAIIKIAAIAVTGAVAPTLIVSVAFAIHKVTIAIAREVAVTVELSSAIQITCAIKVARAIAQIAVATLAELTTVEIAAVKLFAPSDVCPIALAFSHSLAFTHLQEVAYLLFIWPTGLGLLAAAKLLTRRPSDCRPAALVAAVRTTEL
jgi:hypothetical protein